MLISFCKHGPSVHGSRESLRRVGRAACGPRHALTTTKNVHAHSWHFGAFSLYACARVLLLLRPCPGAVVQLLDVGQAGPDALGVERVCAFFVGLQQKGLLQSAAHVPNAWGHPAPRAQRPAPRTVHRRAPRRTHAMRHETCAALGLFSAHESCTDFLARYRGPRRGQL